MVQKYDDKIKKEASDYGISPKSVSYAELGVCMGEEHAHPGSYLFCVASGEVVPRKVFSVTNVWPWEWQRKFSPKADLLVPKLPRHTFNLQTQHRMDNDPSPSVAQVLPVPVSPTITMPTSILPPLYSYPHALPNLSSIGADLDFTGVSSSQNSGTVTPNVSSSILLPVLDSFDVPPFSNSSHSVTSLPRVSQAVPDLVTDAQLITSSLPLSVSSAMTVPVPGSHLLTVASEPVSSTAISLSTSDLPVNVAVTPAVTDLRRSTRLINAKPAIPGSHRSYISHSEWTQVSEPQHIRAVATTSLNDLVNNPASFTIPTEKVGDMTMMDAIAYFSSSRFHLPGIPSPSFAFSAVDTLKPQASSKCVEKTLKQALKPEFAVASKLVHGAVVKHLDMLTEELGTISLIYYFTNIQPDCVRVYGQILVKLKHDNRITARLAAGGNRQPSSSHGETYAPTACESSSNLLLAAYQAFGKSESIPIHVNTFDLSNAFQNTLLDKENYPQQIIMLMPDHLPGKYACYSNQWVEVHKALNGLRQANELFDRDIRSQMHTAGFTESCDPCVYHKQDPTNPLARCTINMHVDDGKSLDTSDRLYQDAVKQLTLRWGTLKFQTGPNIIYNGKHIITHNNGAISISMESYIKRACLELGVAHLPPVGAPSDNNIFSSSTDITPVDKLLYAKFNGCLTHKFDLKKRITFYQNVYPHLLKEICAK